MNRLSKTILHTAIAALALGAAGSATAAVQIFSTGYDAPNGDGTASGGTYNYWDSSYSGTGSTTTDGAALSGGSGDLTDGVVAGDFWYNVENNAGTGPYVGWREGFTTHPQLTFHFTGAPTINLVRLHIDASTIGGVFAPGGIDIDGVNYGFSRPNDGQIGWLEVATNLTGNNHTIQLFQANGLSGGPNDNWIFVSEVTFFGNAVPEPASWALMIAGFGLVGAVTRKRTTVRVSYA
jgi:PEP-CTERM motif